jgi:serine phosphatase RsbU (regulator of sigma subunit)
VKISLGGHPPALLLRADGRLERVGRPGRAIGVFEEARLTEEEAVLAPGDALVLYTDGVTEARSPGEGGSFFGEERLHALVRSCAGLSAEELAGRIEDRVLQFQENELHDDVAVLVLRVPG